MLELGYDDDDDCDRLVFSIMEYSFIHFLSHARTHICTPYATLSYLDTTQ